MGLSSINAICLIILIGVFMHQAHLTSTSYHGGESNRNGGDDDNGGGDDSSPNYKFEYGVGGGINDFGHGEERNGHQTKGEYRVLLPDGRMQIVTYTADKNGYKANVTYQDVKGGSSSSISSSNNSGTKGGYSSSLEQIQPPKDSYGPPPVKSSGSSSFGRRNSGGSFTKLRRVINGRNYNYNYNF